MILALPSGKHWFIERKQRGIAALSRSDSANRVRVEALRQDMNSDNNDAGNRDVGG